MEDGVTERDNQFHISLGHGQSTHLTFMAVVYRTLYVAIICSKAAHTESDIVFCAIVLVPNKAKEREMRKYTHKHPHSLPFVYRAHCAQWFRTARCSLLPKSILSAFIFDCRHSVCADVICAVRDNWRPKTIHSYTRMPRSRFTVHIVHAQRTQAHMLRTRQPRLETTNFVSEIVPFFFG